MVHIVSHRAHCKGFTLANAIVLGLLPTLAGAWSFTAEPLCTLAHQTDQARLTITFDPALPEYTLTITRLGEPWQPSGSFAMFFNGPAPAISTDRHVIEGPTLTVKDRGFGNVLNGLAVSADTVASTTEQTAVFPLDGIAEPLAAFRACPAPVTS